MSNVFFAQVEIIPLLALLMILYNSISNGSKHRSIRRFQILTALVAAILFMDIVNWFMQEDPSKFPIVMFWGINMLYFLLTEGIAFFWFIYVYYQINNNVLSRKQKRFVALTMIPLALVCLIILFSPWNHMIFYIDPLEKVYHRGNLHLIQLACGFGFMLMAAILAYKKSREVAVPEKKREFRFLAYVVLLPFIGGTLQIVYYYFVFLWPFTAAALFLIYIDIHRRQISVDVLTALNNRGKLERYMQQKIQRNETGWYLIMIDVDKFKQINDKYGHIEGDKALVLIAGVLRSAWGFGKNFISRYGGDEFVIIGDFDSPEHVEKVIARCKNLLKERVQEKKLPYRIRLSAGYARFEDGGNTSLKELVEAADKRMYQEKENQRRRGRKNGSKN